MYPVECCIAAANSRHIFAKNDINEETDAYICQTTQNFFLCCLEQCRTRGLMSLGSLWWIVGVSELLGILLWFLWCFIHECASVCYPDCGETEWISLVKSLSSLVFWAIVRNKQFVCSFSVLTHTDAFNQYKTIDQICLRIFDIKNIHSCLCCGAKCPGAADLLLSLIRNLQNWAVAVF